GLLADRARVEDEDVSLVWIDRLAEPELLERTLDALGVVGVHLAAERRDVVATHRGQGSPAASRAGWRVPRACRARSHATRAGGATRAFVLCHARRAKLAPPRARVLRWRLRPCRTKSVEAGDPTGSPRRRILAVPVHVRVPQQLACRPGAPLLLE